MTVAFFTIKPEDAEGRIRIVVKGAPEVVLGKCVRTFDREGEQVPFATGEIEKIMAQYVEGSWVNY